MELNKGYFKVGLLEQYLTKKKKKQQSIQLCAEVVKQHGKKNLRKIS